MKKLKQFDVKYLSNDISYMAGVDEAGRGPLAGPVIAAAVVFDKDTYISGVNDSKKINENLRQSLSEEIKENAITYSYGIVEHNLIDEINILQATLKAMKEAVSGLSLTPDLILVDGNKTFHTNININAIVKGDSKSFSIGAASILAKVKRDEIMRNASVKFPEYLWEKNKGYGTKAHIEAIRKYGPSKYHRKTFLKKILNTELQEELL